MKGIVALLFLSVFATGLSAQTAVPPGTVLPVRLNSSVSLATSKPEQIVTARIMQDVRLPGGLQIHKGAEVVGHLVKLVPAPRNSPAQMIVTFNELRLPDRTVPLHTSLRAVASNLEVTDAQTPKSFDDATASTSATTTLVGGEVAYRSGGHVMNGDTVVGEPVYGGVLSRTRANLDKRCRGAVGGNDELQSLWVFSSDACGVYGVPHLTITRAGRRDPKGEIVLTSASGRTLNVRSGSGMLLRVL
jgi:hypothetical protein